MYQDIACTLAPLQFKNKPNIDFKFKYEYQYIVKIVYLRVNTYVFEPNLKIKGKQCLY